ncbi:tripartite tricarboxylate transporter substrate binding protein [Bordetella sp. BOR01]|uniref:tripartite tricarboxylate transporter substrate binding protein n=1 Tax=Bordetella sp. BOR01 TaxID=2854779 RepID=UPI001C491FA2|nr:tripartite tricarboxylate transporter substrate binding protein [Bordetella sp. BOR01]MBV7482198.1 tripartite tricarboxylate transporter substrate binding protein [Bordetella sp. BOR01]
MTLTKLSTVPRMAAALLLLCAAGLPQARAETFPSRPIRILVPYAPGGGVDFVARTVAQHLTGALGQSVIVENKPGGATNIATEAVARADADGYTLLAASRANAVNATLYKSLHFDIQKDFVPITVMAQIPNLLVVTPSLPAKTVPELIALAKSEPGKLTFASAGLAGSTHLAGELFNSMAGTNILHVPYRGGAPAVVDLMSGQVNMYFATMPSVINFVNSGKVRALAVTSAQRSVAAPQYPTLDELGLKGYSEVSWIGLMAPKGTPPEVVKKLNTTIVKILHDPKVKAQLLAQGAETVANSPEEFATFLNQDIANTAKLIEAAHIALQ